MESILETLMRERGGGRLSGSEASKLTRECLQTALIHLMSEKPFEKISITEIVKRSGVSRQSFYRYYTCKEEVLEEIRQELIETIRIRLGEEQHIQKPYLWYVEYLSYLRENREMLFLLIKAQTCQSGGREYLPAFHDIFSADTTEERYRILAYEGAMNQVISGWFLNGMQEDVVYMAHLCDQLFGSFHQDLVSKL